MKKTILSIVLAMLCSFFSLQAQDHDAITGTIYTQDRKPLAGVTVKIVDTDLGTVTDENGKFSLVTGQKKGTIVFSFTGYEPQPMYFVLGKTDKFTVFMRAYQSQLQEIKINAGYYTVKERERTGSISRVTAETIEKQPVSNPLQALQGRISGVVIVQQSGVPGGGFKVQIRGQNSISKGNDPFYIIDGVPYPSVRLNTANSEGITQDSSPLSLINPNEIETIEVLKDADATAIYGSRGANGVVLVTTKKAKKGRSVIHAAISQGFNQVGHFVGLMNTQEYIAMRMEAFKNDGLSPAGTDYDVNGKWDLSKYTDWQQVLIGGNANITNASLNISGAGNNSSYLVSGNYSREGTVFPGEFGFKRAGLNSALNFGSSMSRFNANLSLAYHYTASNLLALDPTSNISMVPNAPDAYDQYGKLNWTYNNLPLIYNPMAQLLNTIDANTDNVIANANLSYRILKNLTIKTSLGFNSIKREELARHPLAAQTPVYNPTSVNRESQFGNSYNNSWIAEPQLNYDGKLGMGKLNALVGMSFQQNKSEYRNINASNFGSDELMDNMASASIFNVLQSEYSNYKYTALFARLNYSISDRYYLNLTGRRDGSSRFGPGKQFANFGAVGAAWVFSEEKLFKDALPFFSFGKLRVSYGITGNDQISDYQYLQLYTSGSSYQGSPTLVTQRIANADYAWETNRKAEAALQLGLFKDKVNLQVAYFRNRSSNQLLASTLPPSVGALSIQANLPATVQNTGWEFEGTVKILSRDDWNWTSGFNLTIPKNKLISYPGLANSASSTRFLIGQPLLIRRYYDTKVDPQTGVYVFEDIDQNGSQSDADLYLHKFMGPILFGGLQNSLRYKNWNLDFLISFTKQSGYSYLNGMSFQPGYFNGTTNNQLTEVQRRWQNPGNDTDVPKYSTTIGGFINSFIGKDGSQSISANSYVRLKNVSLGYSLPNQWISKAGINTLSLSLQGQNVFTVTRYIGLDPENNESPNKLPPLRTFSIGLKLTL